MAKENATKAERFHDLESISALLLDPKAGSGSPIKDRMIDVGLRGIEACKSAAGLLAAVQEKQPDLLLLDLDAEPEAICKVIQDIRAPTFKTDNPFAVIIALTGDGNRDKVAAALDAGVDAMLAKPISPSALRACLREQVENRADFIATADYVGPDRRPEDREASGEELVSVEVPNTLQQKATGETSDEPVQDRIASTLRSLGAQRSWYLARRIGNLAEKARLAMESGAEFPLLGECVDAIEISLGQIESLNAELNLAETREIVTSARAALVALVEAGNEASARHFEVMRVHSNSLGLAMEQDASLRDVLVTELARAVAAVGGKLPTANGGDDEGDGKGYSWKIRLRAWWEGVDPHDIAVA